MKDIEPNPKLNKVAAGLIAVLALYFFFLAYDTAKTVSEITWGVVAVLGGLGCILSSWALLLCRRPPINAARLRFRSNGVRLEIEKLFRASKAVDLDWADILKVTLRKGGRYGGRSIQLAYGRNNENIWFSPAWTACSSDEIIARLQASAEAAGFTFEKETGGVFALGQDCWAVVKKT